MTQKNEVVFNKAGNIQLYNADIELDSKKGLLTVVMKDKHNNFFIIHKDKEIHISFKADGTIKITAYTDKDEGEIKNLEFESVTKSKTLKIKLHKLLDEIKLEKTI